MDPLKAAPRLLAAVAIAAIPLGCDNASADQRMGDAGSAAAGSLAAAPGQAPQAAGYEVVASDLEVPWDLAFAQDGRIFLTERPGRIRVIENDALRPQPWARLDVAATGEAGLTAIALHPDFEQNGYVYVLGTFRGDQGLESRVVRLTDAGGRGADQQVIVDELPAARIHAGSALDFGPDVLLYVTSGDATNPQLAQQPDALNGKLLRYQADGTPAPGNPLGGPVYALGLRNPQGLDWHASGTILASEHGPSGLPWENGREGDDELNRIVPGGNYGWPEVAGWGGGDRFMAPLAVWNPAIAPSGLAVYTGDDFPAWQGNAFLGGLRGRQLRRVALNGDATEAVAQEALFENELGRIRAVKMGPDGFLYFTTSNRDGRGDPGPRDDRVLRLVPR